MPRVDFVISNDRHHVGMFEPVIQRLTAQADYQCRVVSLCQFRGMASPSQKFQSERVRFIEVVPFKIGRPPLVSRQIGDPSKFRSRVVRVVTRPASWHLLLGRRVQATFQSAPDLAIIANDAAFPYDYLTRLFVRRKIPFLLMQEGIRFSETVVEDGGILNQGRGGANALAVWGETSAEYFRKHGVADEKMHLTGNPRFDHIATTNWTSEADALCARYKLGKKILTVLSNPIELWGFCTRNDKLELFRKFILSIGSLFSDPEFQLVIKLHGQESLSEFESITRDLPFAKKITVLSSAPLFPLLAASQAAVVLASSAGLEALLFHVPLGVLKMPVLGFAYDYVSSGVAVGLEGDETTAEHVRALLAGHARNASAIETYLNRTLASRTHATARVTALIQSLLETPPAKVSSTQMSRIHAVPNA